MKVVSIEGPVAQVEESGVRREARVDFLEDLMVGDYVIVHAGIAIQRLDQEEAEETLRLLKEVFSARPERTPES
jgi:hydrogenase expression/formation protein HypC